MRIWIIVFNFLLFPLSLVYAQNIDFQLHSHNDYEQEHPLTKALAHNFKSIEVDIFEFDNEIIVSHDDDDLQLKPTLIELYLKPLSKYHFKKNQSIFLLIDLKMDGHQILNNLHNVIEPYKSIFKNRNNPSQQSPIQIILSGSVDKEYVITNDSFPYFFVDGRLSDLKQNIDSNLMPLISSDFEEFLSWKPSKKLRKSHLKSILNAIHEAHEQGKLIRFWNIPEFPELWDLLIAMKVDLIGVDDIDKFMRYSIKFTKP